MSPKGIASGVLASVLASVAFGALKTQPWNNFDYAGADEAEQQEFLNKFAVRYEKFLVGNAGADVVVKRIRADAERDLVFSEIQFTDPSFDRATKFALAQANLAIFSDFCQTGAIGRVIKSGVGIELQVTRPSRGPLETLKFNSDTCSPYLAR